MNVQLITNGVYVSYQLPSYKWAGLIDFMEEHSEICEENDVIDLVPMTGGELAQVERRCLGQELKTEDGPLRSALKRLRHGASYVRLLVEKQRKETQENERVD
jgi:hypothetical protein